MVTGVLVADDVAQFYEVEVVAGPCAPTTPCGMLVYLLYAGISFDQKWQQVLISFSNIQRSQTQAIYNATYVTRTTLQILKTDNSCPHARLANFEDTL